ncbi:LPS export ABC transporter periplasmic protein LptC [Bacteroides sp. 224]|uniref:LPS export ABC transporter periplasmic protein LptC n=1 Tax=Bacteroides sp. 224 TaxID=2302936 RepID=UPI00351B71A6
MVGVMLLSFLSCIGQKKEIGEAITERDSLPVMKTVGVTTFISDSGITRYRVDTEEWAIFDRKEPSHWAFEKGVYLEKFDTLFNVDASIKADTAYYYDKQKLWKLISNVEIQNIKGEKFNTDLLYWDENKEKVYSDQYIRIEQTDRIIEGYGFESDQQMTSYKILNIQGILYFKEQPAPMDTTSNPVTTSSDSL